MVRKPFNYDIWLAYHFSKGIGNIFLRVEDTSEMQEIKNDKAQAFAFLFAMRVY